MTKILNNKKGTSLIELIAVIVIMGIIAAVGGVAVATIIGNANKSSAKSYCTTLESAVDTALLASTTGTITITQDAADANSITVVVTENSLSTGNEGTVAAEIKAGLNASTIKAWAKAIGADGSYVITKTSAGFTFADIEINGYTFHYTAADGWADGATPSATPSA